MEIANNKSHKRISNNILATVTQVLISGVVFFVLYRYLYEKLGVEQIGVWSLVLAATSISRMGELGLSAGVVRFVAYALGRNDSQHAAAVVQTVALTLGVFMAGLLFLGYPLFLGILTYFLPTHGVAIALDILPYSLVSLWGLVVLGIFSGGLDGCMRMDLRSLLIGVSHLAYLGMTFILVPHFGLKGVAMAQVIQSLGTMVLMWWLLRRQLRELPVVPMCWSISVLRQMIAYGVNFQIISIMSMLFDPLMKALMSRFGGLEALGYYEMANKLILQGRALIVEASRIMVPAIASVQDSDIGRVTRLFVTSYRMTFYVAVLFYGLLGVSITSISMLWLGHYQTEFILFALLLNFGWFVNTLVGPAYFSNLGSGNLRLNMVSHVIMGGGGVFSGFVLGTNYQGIGVVIGVVLGLVVGSMFLLIAYIKTTGLVWGRYIVPKNMTTLLLLDVLLIVFANYFTGNPPSQTVTLMSTVLGWVVLFVFGWINPARAMFKSSIALQFRRK